MDDKYYMEECLRLAREAGSRGEVPVGALVVRKGQIIGRGQNRREGDKNALAHAEIEAIEAACRLLGGWRLWECDLFVTLEPCPMCAGAIINSRIRRLVFGAHDPKAGACGSVVNLFDLPFNHRPQIVTGLMAEDCSKELTDFFAGLRLKNKEDV